MKNVLCLINKMLLILSAVSVLLIGCKTTEVQAVRDDGFYRMVERSEKKDYYEAQASFPVFEGNLYKVLNDSVNDCVAIFNSEITRWTEGLTQGDAGGPWQPDYSFDLHFTVYEGEGSVSYAAILWEYTGGGHPNYVFYTDTISKATGKRLGITEISGLTENEISRICREQLGKKLEYEDAVAPSKVKDFNFYVDGKTLTILFAPYEAAPYSTGELEVEIALQ